MQSPFLLLVILQLLLASHSLALTELFWTISYSFGAPDCVEKRLVLVNGQHPGPSIDVINGERVVIHVRNDMYSEATSLHFHGIHQRGTPFYDGVAFETQCPIGPLSNFTYNFTVQDQVGSFWWHGHLGFQLGQGLYGSFIVRPSPSDPPPPFTYDKELEPIFINDWYHEDAQALELGILQPQFRWVGDPQSVLINGRAVFPCNATNRTCIPGCQHPVFTVQAGKTYLLRIVNAGMLSFLNIGIGGHELRVVQAEETYTEPVTVRYLDINAGQSYGVLLTTNQPPSRYAITVHIRHRPKGPTGMAVLQYEGATSAPFPDPEPGPAWNDTAFSLDQARRIVTLAKFVKKVPPWNRELFLLSTQIRIEGQMRWAVNNVSHVVDATPTLLAEYYGMGRDLDEATIPDFPPKIWNFSQPLASQNISDQSRFGRSIYRIQANDVVLVVLQNTLTLTNVSEQHPWHLHGHAFWVVAHGEGNYERATAVSQFNSINPIFRNTVTVYPSSWAAILFVADNPGFWSLHCHVHFHISMGMRVFFLESPDALPPLPEDFPICDDVTLSRVHARALREAKDSTNSASVAVLALSVLVAVLVIMLTIVSTMFARRELARRAEVRRGDLSMRLAEAAISRA